MEHAEVAKDDSAGRMDLNDGSGEAFDGAVMVAGEDVDGRLFRESLEEEFDVCAFLGRRSRDVVFDVTEEVQVLDFIRVDEAMESSLHGPGLRWDGGAGLAEFLFDADVQISNNQSMKVAEQEGWFVGYWLDIHRPSSVVYSFLYSVLFFVAEPGGWWI
jgi:hypothetical protein